jgi:Flp pilus assembly pilin Flp
MISDAINRAFIRAYVAVKREEGQTFVEYSLIGVLIAVVLALALTTFEGQISAALVKIGGKL